MRKIALAAIAVGTIAATYTPALAGPPVPGPSGRLCGFASVTDPGTEGGDVQTGQVSAGPLVGDGTVTCTIQVGASQHSGPDAASASADSVGGVAILPPTVISYVSPENVPVYLCTQWTNPDGSHLYYHPATATGDTGHWTTDPNKPCGLATSAGTSDPVFDPIFEAIDFVDETLIGIEKELDRLIICETLKALAPGAGPVVITDDEGDVYINGEFFWDCPEYEDDES